MPYVSPETRCVHSVSFSDGYDIDTHPMEETTGSSLSSSKLHRKYGVTVTRFLVLISPETRCVPSNMGGFHMEIETPVT